MEEFKRGTGGAMLGRVGRTEQEGGDAVEDTSCICPSTYSYSSVHNPPTHPSIHRATPVHLSTTYFHPLPTPSTCPSDHAHLVGLPAPI